MKKYLSVTLIILLFCSSVSAVNQAPSEEASACTLQSIYHAAPLLRLMEILYQGEPRELTDPVLNEISAYLSEGSCSSEIQVIVAAHALTVTGKQLILGFGNAPPDPGGARRYLESAEKLIDSVAPADPALAAQALAVKAELSGSQFLLDRVRHLLTYGLSSSQLIDQALSLDPDNQYAKLLLANKLVYTPPIFGGSVNRAELLLDSLTAEYPLLPPFLQFTWLQLQGITASRRSNAAAAGSWFLSALEIFPENQYTRQLLEDLPVKR